MIVASLVVICVLVGLLFGYQHRVQTADLRIRGVSLVRILAGMPYEQLVPDSATEGPLRVLRASQENTDFAYAIVTGAQGQVLAETTAPGFVVPQSLIPEELSNWQGERIVSATGYDREIIEFYAPIIGADDSLANLRLGFFRPAYGPSFQQLPFFATLALVVFMLTPLFYLMLRREIQPLRDANRELSTLMNDGHFGVVQVQASPELGDFMQRFNQFIELAKGRIKTLEATQVNLETSKKLLTYRKERIQTVLQALPDAVMVLTRLARSRSPTGDWRSCSASPRKTSSVSQRPPGARIPPCRVTWLSTTQRTSAQLSTTVRSGLIHSGRRRENWP